MKYNTENKVNKLMDLKESRGQERKEYRRSEGGMAGRNYLIMF